MAFGITIESLLSEFINVIDFLENKYDESLVMSTNFDDHTAASRSITRENLNDSLSTCIDLIRLKSDRFFRC